MVFTADTLNALSRQDMVYHLLRMHHELEQLKKLIYGARSERFIPAQGDQPQQLALLPLQAATATASMPVTTVSYDRKAPAEKSEVVPHPGRNTFPDHLPRRREVIEPAGLTDAHRKIGEEVTQELEFSPGALYVKEFVRPKYVLDGQSGVVVAPMPLRPIHKGIAGPMLLAQSAVEKYVDAIPLYRQIERYKREGVTIAPATINGWIAGTCELVQPLYDLLRTTIFQAPYLGVDETPIKVLDKSKKGTTHRGYMWCYHDPGSGVVYFDYQPGRGKESMKQILTGYGGTIQCDGFSGYSSMFGKKEEVTLIHCWAHVRRKFFESQNSDAKNAGQALEYIRELYAIERHAKDERLSPDEIVKLRQAKSVPILAEIESWMKALLPTLNPTSPLTKAIAYTLPRWKELVHYTTDGALSIDNNAVENAIRPVAVTRKNFLFLGSHEGGTRAAMLYSLMATCKKNEVNPMQWLADVLERLPAYNKGESLTELLPQNWVKK